jgi:hypothetical protein
MRMGFLLSAERAFVSSVRMGWVQEECGWRFDCIFGVRHRRLQALRTIWNARERMY